MGALGMLRPFHTLLRCKKAMRRLFVFFLCGANPQLWAQTIDQQLDVAKRKIASANFVEAKADLIKLLEANPKNKTAYIMRGHTKMNLRDFYGAIGDFNFALDIDSTLAEAFNYRGEAKVNLGDDQGAIADLDKAIRFNGKYTEAYIREL